MQKIEEEDQVAAKAAINESGQKDTFMFSCFETLRPSIGTSVTWHPHVIGRDAAYGSTACPFHHFPSPWTSASRYTLLHSYCGLWRL